MITEPWDAGIFIRGENMLESGSNVQWSGRIRFSADYTKNIGFRGLRRDSNDAVAQRKDR
jgi:hypothetical protein